MLLLSLRCRQDGAMRPRKDPTYRLALEQLEDRLAPAVILWDGGPAGTGTNWNLPANWVGDALPQMGDEAEIGAAFSAVTITTSADVSIDRVISAASLQISSGTFSVALESMLDNGLTMSGGTLTFSGGAILGAVNFTGGTGNFGGISSAATVNITGGALGGSGVLRVDSAFTWSAGTMTGTGVTLINSSVTSGTISGSADKFLGRALVVEGTVNYTGTNLLFGPASGEVGTIVIANEGVFVANGDGDFVANVPGTHAVRPSNGTFRRLGAGTTTFTGVALNNEGTVQLQENALELHSGGSHTGASTFTYTNGTTLSLSGDHTFPAGSISSGNVHLRVISGTANFNSPFTTNLTGTFLGGITTFNAATSIATVTVNGGTLGGSGVVSIGTALSWTVGTIAGSGAKTVAAAATATISGATDKFLAGVLASAGTVNYAGTNLKFGPANGTGDGTINITGGAFNANGDGDFEASVAGAHAVNRNGGNFNRLGTGGTTFSGVAFNHSAAAGAVAVQTGMLELNGGGTSAGTFTLSADTLLQFAAGTYTLTGGSATGAGFVHLANGGTLNATGAVSIANWRQSGGTLGGTGNVTMTASFFWTGGEMIGAGQTTVAATAAGEIRDTGTKSLGRTLANAGTLGYTGSGLVFGPAAGAVGTFANNGTFTANGDGDFAVNIAGAHVFVNSANGTFSRLGDGTTTLGSGLSFTNNGTVDVQAGTLQLFGAFTNFDSPTTTLTGGTYIVRGTGILQFTGANIVTNAASIILDGPDSGIQDQSGADALANFTTNAAAGSFTIRNGRNFAFPGAWTNNGSATIGAGSVLRVNNLTNFDAGTSTLTGGTYTVIGLLQFTGANIITNAATIILDGPDSAIQDQSSADALANFTTNASGASFTIRNGRNFTSAGDFTNNGSLIVGAGSTLTVVNLTNFMSGALTDGTYNVTGTLKFTGANIQTNAATIILDGPASAIVNETGANGLANLAANAGNFTIRNGRDLTTAGDFSNTGDLTVGANSLFTVTGVYAQASTLNVLANGTLILGGGGTAGGTVTNAGTLNIAADTAVTISGTYNATGTTNLGANAALTLTGDGTSSGTFNLAAGAFLIFGGGTCTLTGGSVTGAGTARVAGGTVTANVNFSVTNYEQTGGTLAGTGNLTVTTSFAWRGGTMLGTGQTIIAATVTTGMISETDNKDLGRTLTNNGTLTYTGSNLRFGPATGAVGRITNAGTFVADGDGTTFTQIIAGAHTFINNVNATFRRQGAGTTTFTIGVSVTNNGTINVQEGTLQLFGAFTNFTGGTTLSGGIYVVAGILQFTGANIVTNAATIVMDGTAAAIENQSGGNALANFTTNNGTFTTRNGQLYTRIGNFTNNGTLNIEAGTSFTVDGNLTNQIGTTLSGGAYIVAGTLRYNGANIVLNSANITLSGTKPAIVDQMGTNALTNFATNNGTFTTRSGQDYTRSGNFTNNGTLNVEAGTAFTVAGNLTNFSTLTNTLSGGIYVIGGTLRFNNANIVTLAANLTLDGAVSAILNPLLMDADALANFATIAPAGSFTVRNGRDFTPTGAFTRNGSLTVGANSTLTVTGAFSGTGSVNVLAAGTLTLSFGGTAGGFLTNAGTVNVASSTPLTFSGTFNNTGTVNLQNNVTLNLGGGGTSSGTFNISAGALVNFTAGFHTLNGATLTGSGTVRMSGTASVTANGNVTVANLDQTGGILQGTGTLTITGQFTWSAGIQTGTGQTTLAATATGTFSGMGNKDLGRTFNNAGTITYTGTMLRFGPTVNANGTINNTGTFNAEGDGDFIQLTAGNHRFINAAGGTFNRSGAAITTFTNVDFTNNGTLNLQEGTLQLFGYTQTGGTTNVAGILTAGSVDIQGGVLAGAGTINANVTMAGTLVVGGQGVAGTLIINGDYTQTEAAVMIIEIGGTDIGTFDQLLISGTATLAGTLVVALINDFVPSSSNGFPILTFAARSGQFVIDDGELFTAVYGGNDLTLVAN